MSAKRKPTGGKRPIPLKKVQAGDAFLAPLEDGRLSVCRVLAVESAPLMALVCGSTWIGTQPPDPADPQLRPMLAPTHHGYTGQPYLLWMLDPVPAAFTRLGMIPPTPEEANLSCASFSNWESFPQQVFWQWRWDHERARMLAEEGAEARVEEEDQERARRAYEPRARQTLDELRRETPLPSWTYEGGIVRASRRIVRETLDALIALGPDAPAPVLLDELQHFVERFNALEDEEDFLDTMEAEELIRLTEDLGAIVGLDDYNLVWDHGW
jgi:hypothetical protein